MLLKGQQMPPVAGHQVVGGSLHSAVQDAVVGMTALDHLREPTGFNDGGGVLNGLECLGRAFLVPVKLDSLVKSLCRSN